jgi:hypothetical protein
MTAIFKFFVGINVGTIMTVYKNSPLNHVIIYTFDFCRDRVMYAMLLFQLSCGDSLLASGWLNLVWLLAVPVAYWLLKRDAGSLRPGTRATPVAVLDGAAGAGL